MSIRVDLFERWRRELSHELMEKFGASYATADGIYENWRETFEYDPRVVNTVVMSAKVFIRTATLKNNLDIDPGFIKAFMNRVAKYTAPYLQRRAPGIDYIVAKNELMDQLWNNWDFVAVLCRNQAANRDNRAAKDAKKKNSVKVQSVQKKKQFSDANNSLRARMARVQRELAAITSRLNAADQTQR